MSVLDNLLHNALALARRIAAEGGRALIVGGYARDEALRRLGHKVETKDVDLEIYGIEAGRLVDILECHGDVTSVGVAFSVWRVDDLDVSIPRRDSKTGPGHKGFKIAGDPKMSFKEAARRRDFTINALAVDPLSGQLIDEYGGLRDVDAKILRATDVEFFGDDPLRVLRAGQFAGRFGFSIDPATRDLCRRMPLDELPDERIGAEWRKLLSGAVKPSIGFAAMRELAVIEKLHPELAALIGCAQDPVWHPEGDVWTHTLMVVDAASSIALRERLESDDRLALMLAAVCHDLGKPATTRLMDGRLRSHGHSQAGEAPARALLKRWVIDQKTIERVVKLILEHLWPSAHFDQEAGALKISDSAVKRLAIRLDPASIEDLVRLAEADKRGRVGTRLDCPEGSCLLARAKQADVDRGKPKAILMGRHLVEMGLEPGPDFGRILDDVFQAQLDERIATLDEAKKLAVRLA